jgi:hypothetical protein
MRSETRASAKALGDDHYFTGKPCKHGHTAARRTADGTCVECNRVKGAKRYAEKRDEILVRMRGTYQCDPEKFKSKTAAYRAANREKHNLAVRAYVAKNKQRIMAAQAEYVKKRKETDPVFAITLRARALIGNALRVRGFKKTSTTAEILGCTWEFLCHHIEKQFLRGMTWDNRGAAWHIDHIVAMATAQTVEDAIALNHFTNLRPMWGPDNLAKGSKQTHLL